MSDSNYFRCPDCQKMTKHIKMTMLESMSNDKDMNNLFGKALGALNDLTGMSKIVHSLVCQPWKCSECGYITDRKADGSIMHYCGKSKN